MDIYRKFFGARLAEAIERAHISQTTLAEKLGVKPSTISRWVNGHDFPEDSRLPEIQKVLNIDEKFFLRVDEKPAPQPQSIETLLNALNELNQEYKVLKKGLKNIPVEWVTRLSSPKESDPLAVVARALLSGDRKVIEDFEKMIHNMKKPEKEPKYP